MSQKLLASGHRANVLKHDTYLSPFNRIWTRYEMYSVDQA